MTRSDGVLAAQVGGLAKELIDLEIKKIADRISDKCWGSMDCWGLRSLKKFFSDTACSAFQKSDDRDNDAGIDGGSNTGFIALSCEECCMNRKGISPETPEGDEARPYGRYCTGRYKKTVEELTHGGETVVVEK